MSKKKWWWEENPEAEGIVYASCQFCGSNDYDMSNGDVVEEKIELFNGQIVEIFKYVPTDCDQCGFGFTADHNLTIN